MVDRLLDRTIAPGYSRLGFFIRRRWWDRDDPTPDALTGKTVVVTGANSGIGAAIVDGVARLGASVVMVVRDLERGESVRDRLAAAHPRANLMVARCDVSDLTDIANFADRLRAHRPQIDAIIHNAGVLPDRWTGTAQGHEVSLATHVLGPILLTELLLPALAAAPDPRVVLMSSGGMYAQPLPADDLEYQASGNYRGTTAYARSKRVQVDLTPALASRWAAAGVMVAVMHSGWADTPGLSRALPGFRSVAKPLLRTPEQAADTALWLAATSPTPATGQFWHDRAIRPTHLLPGRTGTGTGTDEGVERAWRYCLAAVGLEP